MPLTNEGVIYKYDISVKDSKWLKIAYRNNETIKENIKLISFLNERIYGISKDNSLYLGEHRSEGNLTARALAVKRGEQTIVIVNVDVCGLTADFTGFLKKRSWKRLFYLHLRFLSILHILILHQFHKTGLHGRKPISDQTAFIFTQLSEMVS